MRKLLTMKQNLTASALLAVILPATAWAGIRIDGTTSIDAALSLKVAAIFVASLVGGISSAFIATAFDANMKHPTTAKIFIGTCLGLFVGAFIFEHFQLGLFAALLPSYFVATLGAPILVFYLMWISDPQTQAELKEEIIARARRFTGADK